MVPELVGDPEIPLIDSTLLPVLHPRQVGRSAGFQSAAWVRWSSLQAACRHIAKLLGYTHPVIDA